MAKIDLAKYGITDVKEIVHNPSYETLFEEETKPGLEGYEKGQVSELGAVNVMTGIYTGRSPKDKFIVVDENSKNTVWWTSEGYKNDNHPASEETWKAVKEIAVKELCGKKLYVVDAFCGANHDTRMAVRFIVEVAWQAHFIKNMFIRPTEEELENFEPDFVVYNASKAKVENYKELGLNSETAVVFNITSREQVIINTWYGGEMKKGMFSMMNYYLPLKGIASMHCSANTDMDGKNTAIFFGLSGTGKTTIANIIAYAVSVLFLDMEENEKLNAENRDLRERIDQELRPENAIGTSPAMLKAYELISAAGESSSHILIRGEVGAGKDFAMRAIANAKMWRDKPLEILDCSTMRDSLIDAALFGSQSPTHRSTLGLVEKADGGIVYLDYGANRAAASSETLEIYDRRHLHPLLRNQNPPLGRAHNRLHLRRPRNKASQRHNTPRLLLPP